MATYKVPQDVEAEDKLVAFLSLKQFIFTIIMVASLYVCFIFAKINILLIFVPLPFAIVFGVLGLYQRKDQPVEIFLASFLRFKLKPRKRIWDQEGFEQRVIITVPKKVDKDYTKGLSSEQVSSRLNQLSALMDSRGWASKRSHPLTDMVSNEQSANQAAQVQLKDGERLLSAQELRHFSAPPLPLDAEIDSAPDVYENDPRNPVSQSVEQEMKTAAKSQQNRIVEVVKEAREQSAATSKQDEPQFTSRPDHRVQKVISPKSSAEAKLNQEASRSKLASPKPEPTSPRQVPTPKQPDNTKITEANNEVTISIDHHR